MTGNRKTKSTNYINTHQIYSIANKSRAMLIAYVFPLFLNSLNHELKKTAFTEFFSCIFLSKKVVIHSSIETDGVEIYTIHFLTVFNGSKPSAA